MTFPPHQTTHLDLQALAEATAKKTVAEFFRPFGVDVNSAESLKEFGADLGFIRGARELQEARERGRDQGRHALLAVGAAGILSAIGYIVTHIPWPWATTPPGH